MINCKKDLLNKYAVRANTEVFELFMKKCDELEITWGSRQPLDSVTDGEAVSCYDGVSIGYADSHFYDTKGFTKLTLADFKPKSTTKVESELAMQDSIMKYCPMTGINSCYPTHAVQYRDFHGEAAWLFNPWTGKTRVAYDVASDLYGFAITK